MASEQLKQAVNEKAVTTKTGKTIFDLVQAQKPAFEMALGKYMTGDRFVRIALTIMRQNPELGSCEPASLLGALMQSAQLCLEPNTPTGQAYVIPYKNRKRNIIEAQFQIGYKGLIDLFYRSPQSKSLQANVVYENDHFEYEYGLNPKLEHKPANGDRGAVTHYYAVAHLKNGGFGFDVRSVEAIKSHANKYSVAYQKGFNSPWKSDFDSMALKTVIKSALKLMPKSIELSNALNSDETIKEFNENDFDMSIVPGKQIEIIDSETGEILGE